MATTSLKTSRFKRRIDRTWLVEVATAEDPYRFSKIHPIELDTAPLTIGRDEGPRPDTILIDDTSVSKNHARIRFRSRRFEIVDLGSKNGTYVNGVPLKPRARHQLKDKDKIQIAGTFFIFRSSLFGEFHVPSTPAEDDELLSVCPEFIAEASKLKRAALTDAPVLIKGETGTGKEVFAKKLHEVSKRVGTYVAINTAGLQAGLIPAELFGVARGAHSAAEEERDGLIRTADGGTVLLDEIGDMPLEVQPNLLRILQEGEVLPVGADRPVKINVRFIAATHRDPTDYSRVREDLMARLRSISIDIPPLRDRIDDLGLLIRRILIQLDANHVTFAADAFARMFHYDWPQNVRQLFHLLTQAAATADGEVSVELLEQSGIGPIEGLPSEFSEEWSVDEVTTILCEHRGCIEHAARAMNTNRMKLTRFLQRHGLDPNMYRKNPIKRSERRKKRKRRIKEEPAQPTSATPSPAQGTRSESNQSEGEPK